MTRASDARLLFGPFRGLGHAVGLAHDVGLELVEADGAVRDVFLVIGVFRDPHVGDGHGDRGVGAQARGDPLAAHDGVRVVVEGVDEDHLDALLLEPLPPERGFLAGVGAAGGVRVVGPVDDLLRVLQGVAEAIVGLRHAQAPEEPVGVRRAPVPAFPAVGVVEHRGELQHVHEAGEGAHLVAHDAPVVVRRGDAADGRAAVGLLDPHDLLGHDVGGLFPGDALVAGFAAVLRVALAVGVEVHALHGVLDALVRVDAPALRVDVRGERGLLPGRVLLAAGLDGPRLEVGRVDDQGPHPHDLAVLDIDRHRSAVREVRVHLFSHQTSPPDYRVLRADPTCRVVAASKTISRYC